MRDPDLNKNLRDAIEVAIRDSRASCTVRSISRGAPSFVSLLAAKLALRSRHPAGSVRARLRALRGFSIAVIALAVDFDR
jgi:hypothetical protein